MPVYEGGMDWSIVTIEQADKNAISGKDEGSRKPYGFSTVPACIGKQLNTKYGQGAASSAPYMNWCDYWSLLPVSSGPGISPD